MNETMTAQRTPEIIAAEIRALSGQVLGSIIEIGRRFTEAKELIPYGSFGAWVDGTGYSLSTANNFMRIFREYGGQTSLFGSEAESQTLGKLSYTKALALLAVPAEEREQAAVELDAEHLSTRELQEAIRERDEAKKRAETAERESREMERDLDASQEALEKEREKTTRLSEQVRELEERPVEVAVQEADPAEVQKAVAMALDKAEKKKKEELDKLAIREKAERDRLAKELRETEDKLRAAEEKAKQAGAGDKAETEKLRAEAESLKKQLAMSGEALIEFKLRFSIWQAAYVQMKTALEKVPEEQAGKCREAVAAVIAGWQA